MYQDHAQLNPYFKSRGYHRTTNFGNIYKYKRDNTYDRDRKLFFEQSADLHNLAFAGRLMELQLFTLFYHESAGLNLLGAQKIQIYTNLYDGFIKKVHLEIFPQTSPENCGTSIQQVHWGVVLKGILHAVV